MKMITSWVLGRAERRTGVRLDYAREIARTSFKLFLRYGKIFSFLDPNNHAPPTAYHAARLAAAKVADCGTCVEAEVNLALSAGVDPGLVSGVLREATAELSPAIAAVVELSTAVANYRDAPEARQIVVDEYGEKGLIELAYAMSGAALLPGIKRSMGYATACNLDLIQGRLLKKNEA